MIGTVLLAFVTCAAIDGDTLRCGEERIRLLRIDAPEKGQPGADVATNTLRLLVDGREVYCVTSARDKYDRYLGECFIGPGMSLSDLLLNEGVVRKYRGGR